MTVPCPVRVITLNSESSHCRALVDALTAQQVNHELVAGVDGRHEMPALSADETLDQARSLGRRQVLLTSSEVGCYLSHLRAIRTAYEAGLERLCMLEDDVELEPSFAEVLTALASLGTDVELVRLMGLKIHKRKLVAPLATEHMLTRPVKGLCGTQGYVINRAGMEKVLRHGAVIAEPFDKFLDHFWEIDLRCYAVEPHVICERPSESTIRKNSRDKAAKPFAARLSKHVVKIKRSINRRAYLGQRRAEFHPAEKPAERPGRTARMR